MKTEELGIPGVRLIRLNRYRDARGSNLSTYRRSEYKEAGIKEEFTQDLLSYSKRNVLRGLHYQKPPKAQAKLVAVLEGKIFDVVVDLRRGSGSYRKWLGVILSSEHSEMLYIPKGLAHGFCVLSDRALVMYKLSAEFEPSLDAGIVWNDPQIGVKWPVGSPIISRRDASLPTLSESEG